MAFTARGITHGGWGGVWGWARGCACVGGLQAGVLLKPTFPYVGDQPPSGPVECHGLDDILSGHGHACGCREHFEILHVDAVVGELFVHLHCELHDLVPRLARGPR